MEMSFVDSSGNLFTFNGDIPVSEVTSEGLWYRLAITSHFNDQSMQVFYPGPDSTQEVPIIISDFNAIIARGVYPNGITADKWFSIGLPFNTEIELVNILGEQLLNNDNLPYNWGVQSWNTEAQRGQDESRLINLLGYGLKHRLDHTVQIEADSAITNNLQDFYAIELAPGWNLIGWPFAFSAEYNWLDEDHYSLEDDILLILNDDWQREDNLKPFGSYAIYSNEVAVTEIGQLLEIVRQDPAKTATVANRPNMANTGSTSSWRMQLRIETATRYDDFNTLGVSAEATNDFDVMDVTEPPMFEHSVALYFPYTEQPLDPLAEPTMLKLTRDMRAPTNRGHTWEMVIEYCSSEQAATLSWDEATLPGEFGIILFDQTLNLWPDGEAYYEFNSHRQHRFKFIVGTPGYLAEMKDEIELALPIAFELSQNYPNPFNPTTTINFAIARSVDVDLSVYNAVGQLVRTLIDDYRETGFYSIAWDGKNQNDRMTASGMYFYRLKATSPPGGKQDRFIHTKRMMLLK
ncbi:MAG: T9SS type A sorting domain-containing protein [Planctomycetes bacterium]|nr:T9SS type A sorting domain-containing protein [Planctomycetota bacterium]